MGNSGNVTVQRLIWGLFLIALGAMLLAGNLGMEIPQGVWNYWPFLLIALGAAKMLFSDDLDGRRGGGGFWLVLVGLYGWICIWNVWGLSWHTAWPIFVIAGGLSILLKPAFRRRGRDRGEAATENPQGAGRVG